MSFRDRSPLRNGGRFRPDNRPAPGFGARIGDRPRIDDRPQRLDERPPRLDERPPRIDDRSSRMDDRPPRVDERTARIDDRGPRSDWRDRERFEERGRGGPSEFGRGTLTEFSRGGPQEFGRGVAPEFGRGAPSDIGRGASDFGRVASDFSRGSSDFGRGGPPPDYGRPSGTSSDFSRGNGGASVSEFNRNVGPSGDSYRAAPALEFGHGAGVDVRGGLRDVPLDTRGGLRDVPLDVRGGLRDASLDVRGGLRDGVQRDGFSRGLPERDVLPSGARNGPAETSSRWTDASPNTAVSSVIPPVVPNRARTNDCEIIVTHKSLTEYAEFIERRLKKLGLTVDLLFPNEEVPLGRVLANIASRGTLYAAVVTQLSQEHHSVTVNILYGQTQEHRNIPIEDGLQLVLRNFEAYVHGENPTNAPAPGGIPVNPAGIPLTGKHPDIIHTLLVLLVDNKPLTVLQYEKLISYLQDKKGMQLKLEVGDGVGPGGDSQKTQNQLQNRILDILKSSDVSKQSDKPSNAINRSDAAPLLKDPSIQKAIENIVQSNLYKNSLSGSGPGGHQRNFTSSYGGRK